MGLVDGGWHGHDDHAHGHGQGGHSDEISAFVFRSERAFDPARLEEFIGGLVQAGSVQRDGVSVRFVVTDTANDVPVTYTGILPDLFREGKGVVAQGKLDDGGKTFNASEVLAKHDENYMPPEAQHALDKAAIEKTSKTLK